MPTSLSHPLARPPSEPLGPSGDELRTLVEWALQEDIGRGDLTTRLTVAENLRARGTFYSKETLVVAGLPVAAEVFRELDPASRWIPNAEDGQEVEAKTKLATVEGRAAALFSGERVSLNFIQKLSGIATLTRRLKAQLAGLNTQLLDTRKTTPGLRILEKYAVRIGGGRNHRLRLDDEILIKNNHLRLAGGITAAVDNARRNRPEGFEVEVEVRTLTELEEAIAAGAEAVLLDNMTPEQVAECVKLAQGKVEIEVSGGINWANIRTYAETGVDYISVGALTHSAQAVDIHFLIEPV